MKASNHFLDTTLGTPHRYVIPLFQRHYSWKKSNWQQLWDDLLEAREQNANSQFMGALVFAPFSISTVAATAFQVIDGQQRLTTVSLLLTALRNRAQAVAPTSSLFQEIEQLYLIHPFQRDDNRYRVLPRTHDRTAFQEAIDGKPVSPSNIKAALEFFEGQMASLTKDEAECRALFDQIKKMEFVHILLDGENPYQIFSSLNSTGVDLTHADLIRNAVFLPVPAGEQESFDRDHWEPLEKCFEQTNEKGERRVDTKALSGFYRDVLMSRGKYVRPVEIFQDFEKEVKRRSLSPQQIAEELQMELNHYQLLRGTKRHRDASVSDAIRRFLDLDSATAFPLALELLRREAMPPTEENRISSADLAAAFNSLTSFILRRYICGESSRSYGRDFPRAINELKTSPLSNLRTFLLARGWPEDTRFRDALKNFNLYSSDYAKAVLIALNEHKHKEFLMANALTIEHILPQTPTTWWRSHVPDFDVVYAELRHTLGNLTLTAYNTEFANRSFDEKVNGWVKADGTVATGYKDSNVRLTREVASNSKWTRDEITSRAQELAQTACNVWSRP